MFKIWVKAEELGRLPRERAEDWLLALARLLRDMLALHAGGGVLFHEEKRSEMADALVGFSEDRVFSQISLVQEALRRLRSNASQRLIFEGLLLRMQEA